MGKVTIKDVAKATGYSISTVSNALNNVDVLKPQTRAEILKIAEELNYVPNLNGKLLKASKTKTLAFVTTSLTGPYYSTLVDSMAQECEQSGYDLLVNVTSNHASMMNKMMGNLADGYIALNQFLIQDCELEMLKEKNINTVFIDRLIDGPNFGSVVFDSFESGYNVTKYLIDLGHKKIGFIKGVNGVYDADERYRGFQVALKQHKIKENPNWILSGNFNEEDARLNTNYMLAKNDLPTALFAANDLSAFGAITAIKEFGLKVPEDLSVVGFDDTDVAQYYSPKLTTTKNPIAKQGVLAIRQLLAQIEKNEKGQAHVLQGKFIIRDSARTLKR